MNNVEVHKIEVGKKEETPAANADEQFGDPSRLTKCIAITCLVMNVLLPGSGSILAGCLVSGIFGRGLTLTGVAQFIMTICVVGWVWSIYTGIMLIKALDDPEVFFKGKRAFDDLKQMAMEIA